MAEESAKIDRDLFHLANRMFSDYKYACEQSAEDWNEKVQSEWRGKIEVTQRYWRQVMEILTGEKHDNRTPYRIDREALIEIGIERLRYKYRHFK